MSNRRSDLSDRLTPLDARVGDGIERVVRAKHRRRLKRVGWQHALQPGAGEWAQSDLAPRDGCGLEVLIDGVEAFTAMAAAIRGAHTSVYLAQWFLSPGFELVRGPGGESIGALLAEAAQRVDVRVLLWAGSPIALFQPNRKQVRETVAELTRETQIRCEADPHSHTLHCHHEKTLIVDGEAAFIGGLDMTDLKTDRYDSTGHPARRRTGWHDLAVRLTGPAVTDVGRHFAMRWQELTGERLTIPDAQSADGTQTVQIVRTIPEGQYTAVPHGDFSVLESYVRALRDAETLIYLENQFLWSPEITDLIADKLRTPPSDAFRVVILLPSRAHAGQDDTLGQVGVLQAADRHQRLVVVTLRSVTEGRDDPLYVHAKAAVIDDRWLTVGSANLNAHSLLNDTEMNVVCHSPALASDTRLRLWSEHLEVDRAEIERQPAADVVDGMWRPIAEEQLTRQRNGQPPTHRLLAMSGNSSRTRRLLGPLNGLIDDA